MLDLVGNPENLFSRGMAHIINSKSRQQPGTGTNQLWVVRTGGTCI